MIRSLSTLSFAVATLLLCLTGCGEVSSGMPVRGKVTYRGELLTDGSLAFFPSEGRPTTVTLAADGSYACQLPPDDYRVTITLGVRLPAGWKEGDPVPRPAIELPQHYSSRVKTPLRASVAAGQRGPVDFLLE